MRKKFDSLKEKLTRAKNVDLPSVENEKKAIEALEDIVGTLHTKTAANYSAKNILGNLVSTIESAKKTCDFNTVREAVKETLDSLRSEVSSLEKEEKEKPYGYKVGLPKTDHIYMTKSIVEKLSGNLEKISEQFGLEEQEKKGFFGKH